MHLSRKVITYVINLNVQQTNKVSIDRYSVVVRSVFD